MFVVDTTVFVYAADKRSPAHAACRSAVEGWRAQAGAWFTTGGILYEFLRVVSHPRVLRSPLNAADAWRFVQGLLASPGLEALSETEQHAEVAGEVLAELPWLAGNLLHDILMREHGVPHLHPRCGFPPVSVPGGRRPARAPLSGMTRRSQDRQSFPVT